jgi:hypothetical protein
MTSSFPILSSSSFTCHLTVQCYIFLAQNFIKLPTERKKNEDQLQEARSRADVFPDPSHRCLSASEFGRIRFNPAHTLKAIMAYLRHARYVEPQKPRNTHAAIELQIESM